MVTTEPAASPASLKLTVRLPSRPMVALVADLMKCGLPLADWGSRVSSMGTLTSSLSAEHPTALIPTTTANSAAEIFMGSSDGFRLRISRCIAKHIMCRHVVTLRRDRDRGQHLDDRSNDRDDPTEAPQNG
jgi:hypothetical protein